MKFIHTYILLFVFLVACDKKGQEKQFVLLTAEETGITFENSLTFNNEFNVYTYRNYYNGGGVSIGDIDNDGLSDIYFTSNQGPNELYVNKGNFKFENISRTSGTQGERAWSTGVTMVDINADGFLDIYVCNSGDVEGDNKQNELFINNGDLTFTEQAEAYGLADPGFSTHASFFDFDKDGDLDVYLLNNSYQAIGSFDLRRNERPKRDSLGGDKLLENVEGRFVDISEQAGIYGSVIGFGLGVTVGDVNGDAWDDMYISNDFFERDYLYINNQDGTFDEVFTNWVSSTSGASMGADMADINNDGRNDLFITEMLPKDDQRLKTVTTFEDWNRYQYSVKNDYHHQFTRNTFQVNTGQEFLELGRFSGLEATDWSWGALMFDMNNDGYRDIYVANGIYQDLTNQDYLRYISNEEVIKSIVSDKQVDFKKLVDLIPSNPIPNYAFINEGAFRFKEMGMDLGLDYNGFSNGSAYGDLDNDGDLDLVVSNVNSRSLVYKNEISTGNSLSIQLKGLGQNTFGYGAKLKIRSKDHSYYIEQQPTRGFQSSMDQKLVVGLSSADPLEIEIQWPTNRVQRISGVQANTTLVLLEEDAKFEEGNAMEVIEPIQYLVPISPDTALHHVENEFVDFDRDRLLYHMSSTKGPRIAAKKHENGYTIFMGSSKRFYPQMQEIAQGSSSISSFNESDVNAVAENSESLFFDADGDGDLDLYITSGGVEVSQASSALKDQLFLNNGNGSYVLSPQTLPIATGYVSSSTVTYSDIDNDGDNDLFIGESTKPLQYGVPGSGFLLINDGVGQFQDQTKVLAPDLVDLGMINDAVFADLDQDGDDDLLVTGEFMGIIIFENTGGSFTKAGNLVDSKGWWNTIHVFDADADGDVDFIVGNHGLNSRFKATIERPIRLYIHDFDANGTMDPILTRNVNDQYVPYALRHNLIDQIPALKKVYPDYASFEKAHIKQMFSEELVNEATYLDCATLETSLFINNGGFSFSKADLPIQVQFSSVFAISSGDYDRDGDLDLLIGGNLYGVKPEVGRYDASSGHLLLNDGKGKFSTTLKGLGVKGEIRDILTMDSLVLIARNNQPLLYFSY